MSEDSLKTYRCLKCRCNYKMTADQFIKVNSYVKSHKGVCNECAQNIETKMCGAGHKYKMPECGGCLICNKLRKEEKKRREEERKKPKDCLYCTNKYYLDDCVVDRECPDCSHYKGSMDILSYGDTVELEYDKHTFDSTNQLPYSREIIKKVVAMPTHTGLTSRFLNIYGKVECYDYDDYVKATVYRVVSAKVLPNDT